MLRESSLAGSYRTKEYRSDGSVQLDYIDPIAKASFWSMTRPDPVKGKKPTGWLYPKPYKISISLRRDAPGGHCLARQNIYIKGAPAFQYVEYWGNLGWAISGGVHPTLPASANERRKAEIGALTKLKNQRINLGIAFAEANKTADFVGDAFSAIAKSVQMARKKNWKKSFRTLQRAYAKPGLRPALPKNWLGWQYAVKPLINDVNGAIDALKHRDDVAEWITTTKGTSVFKEKEIIRLNAGAFRSRGEVERFRGYFVRLDYTPGNTFLSTLSSLGVTNPLEALWEVVPFSFVIDWAIPIGEWFSSMDAALGFEFLSGSCTQRLETKMVAKPDSFGTTTNGYTVLQADWAFSTRSFSLDRTVYKTSPIPLLPRVKSPLSLGHVANGLSLLTVVLGGSLRNNYR